MPSSDGTSQPIKVRMYSLTLQITLAIAFSNQHQFSCLTLSVSPHLQRFSSRSLNPQHKPLFDSKPSDNNIRSDNGGDKIIARTTFDEAGKSLIAEEDNKRMEAMGDYDLNPDVSCSIMPLQCFVFSCFVTTFIMEKELRRAR